MTKTKLIGGLLDHIRNAMWTSIGPGARPFTALSLTPGTVKAINYQHRGGATRIDFRGTELLPNARGEAKVESKSGYIGIEADFEACSPPPATGRIPHLRIVGRHSGRTHRQLG